MFLITIALQAATLGATNYAADAPMKAPVATPSFADEFEGKTVDTTKWQYDTSFNAKGWFNNELQYYAENRAKNARIEDGALVIEAHAEVADKARFPDTGGQRYTSAKLIARQRLGYGFYEIRAKLPCARGAWPAIWLLPIGDKWPDGGEIEVMEMVGWDANVIHGTLQTLSLIHI